MCARLRELALVFKESLEAVSRNLGPAILIIPVCAIEIMQGVGEEGR